MEQISKYMNQLVEVRFYDHSQAESIQDLLECIVWGKMIECDGRRIVIQQWEADKSKIENGDYVMLIRAAIFEIKPLKYDEERYDA